MPKRNKNKMYLIQSAKNLDTCVMCFISDNNKLLELNR